MDHGACGAASADDQRLAGIAIPVRRTRVEVVQETFHVAIGRAQHVVLEPQRVDGPDRARARVRLRQRKRRFLVRHRNVGAHITAGGEGGNEGAEVFLAHRLAPILAASTVTFEPIVVNEGRTRMLDRPADHTGGADSRGHASSATELRSTPIAGHSISIVSPGLSQTGGSALASFFTGVPVEMMSPGLSVMKVVT